MIDLKITESEKKEDEVESTMEKPSYPYGLRIRIDKDTYKKLQLGKPEINSMMQMKAVVEVVEVSSSKMFGDDSNFSMELQIMSMELGKNEDKEKSSEEVMYGTD